MVALGSIETVLTAALPVSECLAVVNPVAGKGQGLALVESLQDRSSFVIYQTDPNPSRRPEEIAEILDAKRPSTNRPLTILAFGGDRTVDDVMRGLYLYYFRNEPNLPFEAPERALERMIEGGIQVGSVAVGSTNDIGSLYGTPPPGALVQSFSERLESAMVTTLNVGRGWTEHHPSWIFSHTLSAGNTLEPVYEETREERGPGAVRHRRRLATVRALHPRSVNTVWTVWEAQDQLETAPLIDILAHALVRVDGKNGLPGTPQPGIGIKLLPWQGGNWGTVWRALRFAMQSVSIGRGSLKGDPAGLQPDDRMTVLPAALQIGIPVGQTIGFIFDQNVTLQAGGDLMGEAQQLWISALAPFPRFLVWPGSVMERLHRSLISVP